MRVITAKFERLDKMATAMVEDQVDDLVSKFYLESLELLQIRNWEDKSDEFTHFYCEIRDKNNKYTRYRPLRKLGPILIYIFLKTRGILLVLPDFLDLYQINYYEFTKELKKVLRYCPEFTVRDKKFIIKEYIATILKSIDLDEKVTSNAITLFDYFYPLIQHTKEEIIAAVICVLTTISLDLYEISMNWICGKAGIRQSSLSQCLIKKIFPYLGIPNNSVLKFSFELIKKNIRNKTSLFEDKIRNIEDNIEEMWSAGFSIDKISKMIEKPRDQVIDILKCKLGDFQDYKIRYRITQKEIDIACQLRQKGLSYPEIARKVDHNQKITKKIIKKNLTDYTKYDFISPLDNPKDKKSASRGRVKLETQSQNPPVSPQAVNFYRIYEPAVQLYYSLLRDIQRERNQKIPLSKLSYLLLDYEKQVRKNISKICYYLSKKNIYRVEKTVLSLVLALSFPHVPQDHISNLVGVNITTIRINLTIDNIKKSIGSVVKEHINIDLIFEYLEIIINAINKGKIPTVKPKLLNDMTIKVQQIKLNTQKIMKILNEKNLYREEHLILATAIYLSCPSINKIVSEKIMSCSLNKKITSEQITLLQKEITIQKMFVHNQFLLFKQLGSLLEERKTDVLCIECWNYIYEQKYQDNKKIFVCKHCLRDES